MRLITELTKSLNGFLGWDKRRMDCFVKMIVALMAVQTVNLKKLACAIFSDAKVDSSYRRLQRFFSGFRMDYNQLAKLIISMFGFNEGRHYLILDRTNWQWGKSNINVLFLCIAYKKISIPIFWLVLNKKGNSSTRERVALIERFVSVFGKAHVAGVLGDREFVGCAWFQYLKDCKLSFYFRIKKDAVTINAGGKSISVYYFFFNLSLHQPRLIKKAKPIYGHKLYITGMRIDDDYLIVVTNLKPDQNQPDETIKIYAVRWEIETMFGCLKSKGFNFEDTHIIKRDRIKKLIAVLAISFCWAHLTGEWRHQFEKVITLKKHGRLQYSFFRYGLDWIMTALFRRGQKLRQLVRVFKTIIAEPISTSGLGASQ